MLIIIVLLLVIIVLLGGGRVIQQFFAFVMAAVCMGVGFYVIVTFVRDLNWITGGSLVAAVIGIVALFIFYFKRRGIRRRRAGRGALSGGSAALAGESTFQQATMPNQATPPASIAKPKAQKPSLPDDPISKVVNGRIIKRALWDVEELIQQDGMIAAFKSNGFRISGEKDVWQHPTGIYLVCPSERRSRVFSRLADARKYRDQQTAAR